MRRGNRGLMAVMGIGMGMGLALSVWAGPPQAGVKADGKRARAAQPAASKPPAKRALAPSRVAAPLHVKIRPAKLAVAPPAPVREPVLLPVAIEEEAAPARAAKAPPVRAYARDGVSFYQDGQLIRIQGLVDDGGGEHAKQRLQQFLDGGQVAVLPVGGAADGEITAVVRVNGRDAGEALAGN